MMKIKNGNLLILLSFALFSCADNHSENDNKIITNGASTISLPADRVVFNVKITASDKDLNKVYENYRSLENNMVVLLEGLNIPKGNISFSLLSIGKQPWRFPETLEPPLTAEQNVTFILDSVSRYSEVQSRLITNGFNEFNSNFTSTKIDDYKKQTLENAVLNAKNKAEILANAGNRKIKKISSLSDADEDVIVNAESMALKSVGDRRMTDINQQLSISAKVRVIFELE